MARKRHRHMTLARKRRGYIDQEFLAAQGRETVLMDANELLVMVRDQVEAALTMLGHAKDTAGSLRFAVDDGEVEDDAISAMAMYLEDDIDEIENGYVYDLFVRIKETLDDARET